MEKDKDYEKVINILHKDFGWEGLERLEDIRKELLNDVIVATKSL